MPSCRCLWCICMPFIREKTRWTYYNKSNIFLVQVRLRTEVLRTLSLTRLGFKLMTSRSWQYIPCHWDACSNHLAISDLIYRHIVEIMTLSYANVYRLAEIISSYWSLLYGDFVTFRCDNTKMRQNQIMISRILVIMSYVRILVIPLHYCDIKNGVMFTAILPIKSPFSL